MRSRWLLVMLAGCRQIFGFEDPATVDAPLDQPPPQCRADQPGTCTGTTPICGAGSTCRGCLLHGECASNACVPSGACADPTDVAYIAPGGMGVTCTQSDPCGDLVSALADRPAVVKMAAGTYDVATTTSIQHDVTIVADPGAIVRRTTAGPVIDIPGADDISISDLEIRDGLSSTGHGIQITGDGRLTLIRVKLIGNGGRGIEATAARTLTMSRCIVATNASGGIDTGSADLDITNSLIVQNGSSTSTIGGLRIQLTSLASRLAFDTIADNITDLADAQNSAIKCDVPSFIARNNIVSGNSAANPCQFDSSLFDVIMSGGNNRTGDPAFANTDPTHPTSPTFYRITEQSAAIDAADPAGAPVDDIDGDPRPSGNAPDIGADELR